MFIEERNQSWNTPYLFNGKELDEETGLYYYGARYYNPRESVWLSVDPLFEETMTPYQYTYQNPIRFTDPMGMEPDEGGDGGFWRGIGNLFKSRARINAEDKVRLLNKSLYQ
nr:RHS repeat-associated core domain-containing protein [Apibacter adventoris]